MKDDSGSAFPMVVTEYSHETQKWEVTSNGGMTLRQYYAIHAPESPDWWRQSYKEILGTDLNLDAQHEAQWRFCYADVMIAEGKK